MHAGVSLPARFTPFKTDPLPSNADAGEVWVTKNKRVCKRMKENEKKVGKGDGELNQHHCDEKKGGGQQ